MGAGFLSGVPFVESPYLAGRSAYRIGRTVVISSALAADFFLAAHFPTLAKYAFSQAASFRRAAR